MAWIRTRVGAEFLDLPAWLVARFGRVLALSRSMAVVLARVGAAFEFLAADKSAAGICQPTGLILQRLLRTQTTLFC